MLDPGKLRKRVMLTMLSSPMVLGPLVLGITLLGGALAFAREAGAFVFTGLACLLGAGGVLCSRWMLGSERMTRQAVKAMEREENEAQECRLNDLERRLKDDGDPRTEAALGDLRAFWTAFQELSVWAGRLNAASAFEIVSNVRDLFNGSVQSLETSLELWDTAQGLQTPSARKAILERREEIVRDVQTSIEQLSQVLVGIQRLGAESGTALDLSRVRAELDESLVVARRVEDKIKDWQNDSALLE